MTFGDRPGVNLAKHFGRGLVPIVRKVPILDNREWPTPLVQTLDTHKPDIRLLATSEVILRRMSCGKAFWLCEFNKLWTSQLSEVTQCLSRRLPIDTVTRLLLAINQLLTCLSQDKERLRKAVLSRVQATLNWSWGL